MPPKKKEYEETFNKLLDMDIGWSRLHIEVLIKLTMLFNNPELLFKKLKFETEPDKSRKRILKAGIETAKEIADGWQGPIARFFKRVIEETKKPDISVTKV